MTKLKNVFLYGGLDRDTYQKVKPEIDKYNYKYSRVYALILAAACFVLFIFTSVFKGSVVNKSKIIYLSFSLSFFAIAFLNKTFYKKTKWVLYITQYMLAAFVLAFGIILAMKSSNDVSASYMVLLFAVPLTLVFKPIILIAVVVAYNTYYCVTMYYIQSMDLFMKDLLNAIIYCLGGLISGISIIRMKTSKFVTDYENERIMRTDKLSGLLNRHAYMEEIELYDTKEIEADVACLSCDLNGLKRVNDSNGHFAGDNLLVYASACLSQIFGPYGNLYRVGGDEFVAILHVEKDQLPSLILELNEKMLDFGDQDGCSISVGFAHRSDFPNSTLEEMLSVADQNMYKEKEEYYESQKQEKKD